MGQPELRQAKKPRDVRPEGKVDQRRESQRLRRLGGEPAEGAMGHADPAPAYFHLVPRLLGGRPQVG